MSVSHRSERMRHVGLSGSLELMARVRELRAAGAEIIDFGHDGDSPTPAKAAAIRMLDSPQAAGYQDARGVKSLRQALGRKLARDNAIEVDPDSQILVTVGAKEAVLSTLLALVDRGDEVIVEDPGWISFAPMVRIAGADPVAMPLPAETGFRFTLDALRERVTSRTRMLVLCNPHNPTGRCLDRLELEAIGEFCRDADLMVLVDEAYEHFVYDGRRHLSLASLPGMADRTVTVQTVSKIYNMPGWRLGWLCASPDIVASILAVHSHVVGCVAAFVQAGGQAAIESGLGEGDSPIASVVERFERQRDAMVRGLSRIPGVVCPVPEGAYFTFPSIEGFGMTDLDASLYLLEKAGVATTPGSLLGACGEGRLRLVFKSHLERIERGVERIGNALCDLEGGRCGS